LPRTGSNGRPRPPHTAVNFCPTTQQAKAQPATPFSQDRE